VAIPAPECRLPEWPAAAAILDCGDTDVNCYIVKSALYIADAERVGRALLNCEGIVWIPYEEAP
jgi:hypothetical protein